MAINRYTTSSRFSPDTTDPITEARIADPEKMGKISPQGDQKITSWPDFRDAYDRGEIDEDSLLGANKEVKDYMSRKTNKISERFAEPTYYIRPGSQKAGVYRSIGDQKFQEGDVYTQDESKVGKRMAKLSYDAERPENRSMVAKRISRVGNSNPVQGASFYDEKTKSFVNRKPSGEAFSEKEASSLYPDLQLSNFGSKVVGMRDFGQSAYGMSKAQIKEAKDIADFEDREAKDMANFKKSVPRLPIIKPKFQSEKMNIIDNRKGQGEYVEPLGPGGVRYVRGKRSEKIGTAKQRRQNLSDRIFRGTELKTGKTEGTKGYFKNLGEKRRFRREGKLAKASFGRGFNEMDSQERADRKKMLKEERRSFTGAAFRRPGQGGLAAARDTGREIRDINRAEKYSERTLGFGPEIKDYTPKVMKNYRSSEDNPLNRNRRSI